MMRRTKGPMWVKEVVLVCFHMWHRYAAVRVSVVVIGVVAVHVMMVVVVLLCLVRAFRVVAVA